MGAFQYGIYVSNNALNMAFHDLIYARIHVQDTIYLIIDVEAQQISYFSNYSATPLTQESSSLVENAS